MAGLKFTKDQINQELFQRSITMIGDHLGMRVKSLFECNNCGHQWLATPDKVVGSGTGCPSCAANNKNQHLRLTKHNINAKLLKEGRTVRLVGDYLNARTPVKFECLVCSNQWNASADNVINKRQGCPVCAAQYLKQLYKERRLSEEEINTRLSDRTVMLSGEYHGANQLTSFTCLECDFEWKTRPSKVLGGTGCPLCTKSGFTVGKNASAYVIEFESFIKYGITNNPITRLDKHRQQGMLRVIECREYADGTIAQNWEKQIKSSFGGKYVNKSVLPDGFTETLPKHLAEHLIRLMP